MAELKDLVGELLSLNAENLAQRCIDNSDVEWCLSELMDMLAADMEPVTRATTATVTATRRIEDDGMAFDSFRLEAAKQGARMDLMREAERLGAFVESVEQYAGKSYVKIKLTVMVPQGREVREE